MADTHDIVAFLSEGEKILGIVIEHYVSPLEDFYVIYADYALHKSCNLDENASIIIDNVIIPACDAALSDYRLKKQHLNDLNKARKDIEALIEAITSKMNIGDILEDNTL